jgi:uncharacterized protein (TIGR02001 family)
MRPDTSPIWKPLIASLVGAWIAAWTPNAGFAAGGWSASIDVTSEYFVRGISRSNGQPALQGDLRVDAASGLSAGLGASSVWISPTQPKNIEASGFAGWTFNPFGHWQAGVALSHYDYLQNQAGAAHYDYDELSLDLAPRPWLALNARYSHNTPRYVAYLGSVVRTANRSVEANLTWPLRERLSLLGGVGRAQFSGPDGAAYTYWSAGGRYDLGSWTGSVTFIDTSRTARTLYGTASPGRLAATVMRRF